MRWDYGFGGWKDGSSSHSVSQNGGAQSGMDGGGGSVGTEYQVGFAVGDFDRFGDKTGNVTWTQQ